MRGRQFRKLCIQNRVMLASFGGNIVASSSDIESVHSALRLVGVIYATGSTEKM